MYENLTPYERALARFGDACSIIAGLEIANKLSPEDAYQEIKKHYKEIKRLRKLERESWYEDEDLLQVPEESTNEL